MTRIQNPSSGVGGSTISKASVAEVNTGTNDAKFVTPFARAGSDGWQAANEDWTYASASTITVPAGAASKYAKGDRIKWTQTTVKYGVIVTVADTLLTIAVNTDFVVTDAAISANYYSHQESPVGYPQWFATAPPSFGVATFDDGAGGQPTTQEIRMSITGRSVKVHGHFSGTKAATGSNITFTNPPFPAAANTTDRTILGVSASSLIVTNADTIQVGQVCKIGATYYCGFTDSMTDNSLVNHLAINLSYEF